MQADRNCDIYLDNVRVENRAGGRREPSCSINLTIGRIPAQRGRGRRAGAFKVSEYTGRTVAGKPIRGLDLRGHAGGYGVHRDRRAYLTVALFDRPETYGPQESRHLSREVSPGSTAPMWPSR
jgi:hypothetical protein